MRNQLYYTSLLFAASLLLMTLCSFNYLSNNQSDIMSNNVCTVHVKTSYGSDAKSVKVSTDVSGGISCIGGRSFYTNSDGIAELEWSSGCYLKKIFVDGKGYEVNYKDGGSYSINMR